MELLKEEVETWRTLLNSEGWPLFEREIMRQLNQRAEAILLKTGLSDKEREYLRGELSYGMYAVTLPKEMIASAESALALLYQDRAAEETSQGIDEEEDDGDSAWRID